MMSNLFLIKNEAKIISTLYFQKADRILKELKQPERQLLQQIILNSYSGNPLDSEVVQLLKKLQDMQAPNYRFTRDNGFWANLMRRIKNALDRIDSSTIRRQIATMPPQTTIPDKAYIWFQRNSDFKPIQVPEDTKQMLDSFLDLFINTSSFYKSPLAQMAIPKFNVQIYKDRKTGEETLVIAFYIHVLFPDATFKTEPLAYVIPKTKEELFAAVEEELYLLESIPAFIDQLNGLYLLSRKLFLDEAQQHGYKEKSYRRIALTSNEKEIVKPVGITYSSLESAFTIATYVDSEGTIDGRKKSFWCFEFEFTLGLGQNFLETYTKYFQQEIAKEVSKEVRTQISGFTARMFGPHVADLAGFTIGSDDFENPTTLETFNKRIDRLRELLPDISIDSASPDNLDDVKDQLKTMQRKGNLAFHPDKQGGKEEEFKEFHEIFIEVKAFYKQQKIDW